MTFKIPALQLERARQAKRLLKAIEMNAIDIYRRAIKRTFADLYGVAPDEVDVSWRKDGDNITDAVQIKPSPTILSMMMTTARSNSSPPMKTPSPSD